MQSHLKSLDSVIREFSRLPGIGKKSAQRVAFHLLNAPEEEVQALARALTALKSNIRSCSRCFNIAEAELCGICGDTQRDQKTMCIVEEPHDITAIENAGSFRGVYHVLGGVIAPLDNVGPEDLHISELICRLESEGTQEVILALNPTTEGDSTNHYLAKLIKPKGIKLSMLARGIPAGGDLEYVDQVTVSRALDGRVEL